MLLAQTVNKQPAIDENGQPMEAPYVVVNGRFENDPEEQPDREIEVPWDNISYIDNDPIK